MSDANVLAVCEKLQGRAAVGLRKYGVTTERDDLSALDWLRHLQEELMDACVYIEAAMASLEPRYTITDTGRAMLKDGE